MKKYFTAIVLSAIIFGCGRDEKVVIKGIFPEDKQGTVYLEQSDVDRNTRIDTAVIRKGKVHFTIELQGPEFYQIGLGNNDFVSILAMPGENIELVFGESPLITNYTVSGSPGSEKVRDLDIKLYKTKVSLDSVSQLYSSLSDNDILSKGPVLEKQYTDLMAEQRKYNIGFILENISSMASVKALYQRIDDDTYVLYQPRDLQFLKIVSDTLSVKYPTSKHVLALTENFKNEYNKLYLDHLTSVALQSTDKIDPDLPDTDGNRVKLSSLRGKYVLMCFWVTTGETSMENLLELKSIYKSYHGKGLEIYQISLDRNVEQWKNVVKFEEIPWISVREDDPLNPRFATIFNIQQLPSNMLFDPQGEIINVNLYGRNLQIKMDQLFNK